MFHFQDFKEVLDEIDFLKNIVGWGFYWRMITDPFVGVVKYFSLDVIKSTPTNFNIGKFLLKQY